MRRKSKFLFKRCLIMMVCFLFCCSLLADTAYAESSVDDPLHGVFYVVYDNSESASDYRMKEAFSYILEYMSTFVDFDNGSKVLVYPMLPITISGVRAKASTDPIVIDSYEDVSIMRDIRTVDSGYTSFDSVVEAYNDLITYSGADIKHLFIISDCDFNDPISIGGVIVKIDEMLKNAAGDPSLQIHCVIDAYSRVYDGTSRHFEAADKKGCNVFVYNTPSDAAEYCVGVCANTFNHEELISTEEDTVEIFVQGTDDTLFVFAYGTNAENISLTSPGGMTIQPENSLGFGDGDLAPADDFGQLGNFAVYTNMEAGTYTLQSIDSEGLTVYTDRTNDSDGEGEPAQIIEPLELGSVSSGYIPDYHYASDASDSASRADNLDDDNKYYSLMIIAGIIAVAAFAWVAMVNLRNRRTRQVFISYRRGDVTSQLAGRLYDRLKALNYKVFMDRSSLKSGDYPEQLHHAIDASKCFIVILSPGALERRVGVDHYLDEIVHAIKDNKRIIPVVLPGFSFPESLEEELSRLERFQTVELSEQYFDAVVEKIVEFIND